ncbi:hypothetical protein GWK47_038907 [Chionoecetes opilio]|uniref:Uncharacterized protein n=1 Tax=Chionoecetes opilio TaxID=41210 RepID=A0A8J5D0N2_CHIOP|nr:hypothetical protein GWK47_038907 [Chionoecetes opilio]
MSVGNLGHEEMLSPTPSPQLESNATTTTPQHYYSRNELGVPEAYKEYVYASRNLADASNDARLHLARLYVLLPCVVVAALVVVCGLCSRQFFCYTFSLYNSLCLWVLTLTWIIIYQTKAAWESRMPLDNVGWVELVHVVLMLLLSVQIFSIFSINITTVVMLDPPLYRAWGSVMVLCANSATLVRTLPPAVMQLRFKKMDNIPVNQRVIGMSLECAALLVGAIAKIAMCNIRCYSGGEIIVVVMNLLFFGFQIFIIVHMLKGKYASEQSEDTERRKEIDEVSITSQGRDYEQDSNDLSA